MRPPLNGYRPIDKPSGRTDEVIAGRWKLDITVPPSYPIQPPTINFLTPICHPNVHFQVRSSTQLKAIRSPQLTWTVRRNQTGEICIDLLKDSWSPTYTLTTTLEAIHHLLSYPEVDSPLNVDIAMLLKNNDRIGGESLVRFWCAEKRWSG